MRKFEKQFRTEHPETVGEKDSHFDLDNYTEWLESQISELQPVNKTDDATAFLQAVKSQRSTFCSTIMHQDWDTVLRTECESLLIMYDQMAERIQERKAK